MLVVLAVLQFDVRYRFDLRGDQPCHGARAASDRLEIAAHPDDVRPIGIELDVAAKERRWARDSLRLWFHVDPRDRDLAPPRAERGDGVTA